LLGDGTTEITISPAGATESASNPEYTVVNAFLASFQPINGTYGELSMEVLRHLRACSYYQRGGY
jgi:hypothetical protein